MLYSIFFVFYFICTQGVSSAPSAAAIRTTGHKIQLSRRSFRSAPYKHAKQLPVCPAPFIRREVATVLTKYAGAPKFLRGPGLLVPPQSSDPIAPNPPAIPNSSNEPLGVLAGSRHIVEAVSNVAQDTPIIPGPVGVSLGSTRGQLTDYVYQNLDFLYYGRVGIGTPAQDFGVDIDTGSADTWVPVSDCPGLNCPSTRFYPEKSSTYRKKRSAFAVQYGSGSVYGSLGSDTFSLGSLVVDNQAFGAVTHRSEEWDYFPSDGLLGLAFTTIASSRERTFFENLIHSNKLADPLFGVHLERGRESGSELCLGCIDKSKTTGPIIWHSVAFKTYWTIHLDGFALENLQIRGDSIIAAIDTGTTLIYVPASLADRLYEQIPASEPLTDSLGPEYHSIPCNFDKKIALVFNGQEYNINLKDFNLGRVSDESLECVGGILGLSESDGFDPNLAIIGDEFLKNWYSIYDHSGGARVGFAPSINNQN